MIGDATGVRHPVGAGGRRHRTAPSTVLFLLTLVGGAVLRLHVVGTDAGRLNADDAVTYLQALRAGHGHLDVFFWGQAYGGSVLPWTVALPLRLLGGGQRTYQLLASLWWLAATLVYRQLALRLWDRAAGDLTGIALWLGTAFGTVFSVTEPDFYGPTVALGGAALLVATATRPNRRHAAAVGLLGGLAFWAVPLGAAFAVPAVVLVLRRSGRPRELMPPAAAAALVGAAPWLADNLRRGSPSLAQPREPLGSIPGRVVQTLTDVLPWALPGARHPAVRDLVAVVALVAVVGGGTLALRTGRGDRLALAATAVLATVVVADTKVPLVRTSVRYATFLLPLMVPFLAAAVTRVRAAPLAATALGLALCAGTTASVLTGPGAATRHDGWGPPPDGQWGDLPALEHYLDSHGERTVWANYWTAYPLTADTGTRILAAPLQPRRFPPYDRVVDAAPRTVVVVARGQGDDRKLRTTGQSLGPVTRTEVGGFVVYAFAGHVPISRLPTEPF